MQILHTLAAGSLQVLAWIMERAERHHDAVAVIVTLLTITGMIAAA